MNPNVTVPSLTQPAIIYIFGYVTGGWSEANSKRTNSDLDLHKVRRSE